MRMMIVWSRAVSGVRERVLNYPNILKITYMGMTLARTCAHARNIISPVDFQPKMALPGDSLPKLVIYTPK